VSRFCLLFEVYFKHRFNLIIHPISSVNVQCAFDETEEALLMLEDLIETQELREKQLEHRFQLALYQERREAELDDLKGKNSINRIRARQVVRTKTSNVEYCVSPSN